MPTKKAPSKGRKYTQAEINAINNAAPKKIDAVNEASAERLQRTIEQKQWERKYKRLLT